MQSRRGLECIESRRGGGGSVTDAEAGEGVTEGLVLALELPGGGGREEVNCIQRAWFRC